MDEKQALNNHSGNGPSARNGSYPPDDEPLYQGRAFYSSPGWHHGSGRSDAAEGFNILTLLRILTPRWMTVALLVFLGGVCGILYIVRATPVYEAQAELEMSVRRPKVINNEAVFQDPSATRDTDVIFNTRFANFRSPAMERLASKEYLTQYPEAVTTTDGRLINRGSLALCTREVKWSKDPNANIVYVTYQASDPVFAARLVNVMSHCAGILMMQENQAISDEAVKWLKSQVKDQRASLETIETELAASRAELQLDSLEQQKAALGQALVTVSEEKEALISSLASRRTVYDFIFELQHSESNLEMLPSGLPKEEELNELIRAWRAAHDGLMQVANRYTAIHPEYRKMAETEERTRARLTQFIELLAKAVYKEVELLEKQVAQTEKRITKMKTDAVELEQQVSKGLRQLEVLERKRDAADTSYQSMLVRMEEARLSADENMAFTKVIRKAAVPLEPVSPRKGRVMVASSLLGLIAGVALTVIQACWTGTVGSVADLKVLNLNILSLIPSQKKVNSRAELATIGLKDKFNPLVEIFAGINSLISSDRFAGDIQVVLASSAGPGEGKTISACNLAISAAFNGSRTLLIDGDLRRPQLATIFNIDEKHPSLIEWLADRENTGHDTLVSKGVVENLDMITSRPHDDINPAELLGRDGLSGLIAWARENYDRVVIDSPPMGVVGDAQVFANLVDAVILVARIGKTKQRGIKFAMARFNAINAPVLGCIANDVPNSLVNMFGGAEGYGYAYGPNGYHTLGKG